MYIYIQKNSYLYVKSKETRLTETEIRLLPEVGGGKKVLVTQSCLTLLGIFPNLSLKTIFIFNFTSNM